MNKVAIIPARGGSKRIPRKNIRKFADKPMIAHSIETSLVSGLFDEVIVSTDDEEIADIARSYGAAVPFFRPKELSDDYIGTTSVMSHAIRWLNDNGHKPEIICCIYATAPFIQVDELKKGLDLLENGTWQYVFSASKFTYPIFRGFEVQNNGNVKMFFPDNFDMRSQDFHDAMHDAGQFYWGRAQAWSDELRILDHWSTIVELPAWRVQDIDTLDDWNRAERIYEMIDSGKVNSDYKIEMIDLENK